MKKQAVKWSGVLLTVFVVTMVFGCGGHPNSESDLDESGETEYQIPEKTIVIDGDMSDWADLTPVYSDDIGDENSEANFEGTDLDEFFMAQDQDYVYFMMSLNDGKPREDGTMYVFVANQIAGEYDTKGDFQSVVSYVGGQWFTWMGTRAEDGSEALRYASFNTEHVAAGANFIEWKIPKEMIPSEDINKKYVRVYIHNISENAPVSDENMTDIMLILNDAENQPAVPETSPEEPADNSLHCWATCDEMSWGVTGGVGPTRNEASCRLSYVGSSYIEYCTGTLTYEGSGDVYQYSVEHNWPNCSINVEVEGLGSCFDSAS